MSDAIDCALVASDLHCLSTFALLRPGFVTSEDNEIGLNKFQKWLWAQYESCLEEVDRMANGRKFALFINGDLIEGNHHRTKEILSVDEWEHARAAIYTLQPLVDRAAKIFVTEGTECHTGTLEHAIAKEIGAEKDPNTGRHAFTELPVEVHGCFGLIRHHMPTTSRVYLEASQLSIQLGNSQLSHARVGHRVPKFVCGAHRHRTGAYNDGNALMCVTPAWQGLTRFGRKVVPDGKITPGFVWLDWANREHGEIPDARIIIRNPEEREIVRL